MCAITSAQRASGVPLAAMPPTSAPALHPAITSIAMPNSCKANKKPVCAYTPRPPPELNTTPIRDKIDPFIESSYITHEAVILAGEQRGALRCSRFETPSPSRRGKPQDNSNSGSANIRLGGVAAHHAMGVEERGILGDGTLHDGDPAGLDLIVKRQHRLLQHVVQRTRNVAVSGLGGVADGPAGDTHDAAIDPPAVHYRQLRHAVERGLHAAGAARLQRTQRCVEPDVHPRHQTQGERHVVIGQKYAAHDTAQIAEVPVDHLDRVLAWFI